MNTLLDTKFRHKHIEGSIKYTDNSGLTNNRSIALCEVRNKDAQIQVSGLLFCQLRRIPFTRMKDES